MSSTVSMWLGVTFVALGVAATILQAWLWRFPMVPDPGGPDPNGRSTAPRLWTNVHRLLGLAFVVIYVIMMIEMVPRLWEYQVELPARTVMHACMGITIGFLLVVKIAIIRWFQHFGKALPTLGLLILLCTFVLATLSVPYAVRAHAFGTASSPANLARVERLLTGLELEQPASELATEEALVIGRSVLTNKCVTCHDLQTILRRPYTPEGWQRVVVRMATKPQVGVITLDREDLAPVIAYLVAITPDIQTSLQQKRREDVAQLGREVAVKTMEPVTPLGQDPAAMSRAKAIYQDACTQCHELDEVDAVAPKDGPGWRRVVERMIADEGAEIEQAHAELIVAYLTATRGPGGAPAPAPTDGRQDDDRDDDDRRRDDDDDDDDDDRRGRDR